jgi:hypothetical protein
LDVDEGIVEQGKLLGISIIWTAELKIISTCQLKWAFLMKAHRLSDGKTLPTEPLWELQDMVKEFQGHFGKPTVANLQKGL